MPNHCENDLYVWGNPVLVAEFLKKHAPEGKFDVNTIIPYPEYWRVADEAMNAWEDKYHAFLTESGGYSPEGYEEFCKLNGQRPQDGYNQGGYEWCCANWGTKWGAYRHKFTIVSETPTHMRVKLQFDTAWAPIKLDVYCLLSEMHPRLTFRNDFFERGMQYKGRYKVKNGAVLIETQSEYKGRRGG